MQNLFSDIPDDVSGVMVDKESITITESNNITFTLVWSEPFNNFDPIINYTISCSGDPSCPQDITTPDNTTSYYTITDLLPGTDYTFTVIATNSIGSGGGEALMTTTPTCEILYFVWSSMHFPLFLLCVTKFNTSASHN